MSCRENVHGENRRGCRGGFRWVCGSARLSARAYPVLLIGLIGIRIRFPEKVIRRHGSIPIKIHTGHKIDYIAENSTEIRESTAQIFLPPVSTAVSTGELCSVPLPGLRNVGSQLQNTKARYGWEVAIIGKKSGTAGCQCGHKLKSIWRLDSRRSS